MNTPTEHHSPREKSGDIFIVMKATPTSLSKTGPILRGIFYPSEYIVSVPRGYISIKARLSDKESLDIANCKEQFYSDSTAWSSTFVEGSVPAHDFSNHNEFIMRVTLNFVEENSPTIVAMMIKNMHYALGYIS